MTAPAPCARCGETPDVEAVSAYGPPLPHYFVACPGCADVDDCRSFTGADREAAIAGWNAEQEEARDAT